MILNWQMAKEVPLQIADLEMTNNEPENIDQLMSLIIEYYKKHSKITEEELKDTLSRDRNWGMDECIKRGIVDEEYTG